MNATILLGPPGAGKGTVAKVLVKAGYRHISTGHLLREEIAKESCLGLEAKKLLDKGQFAPDDVAIQMVESALRQSPYGQKVLLDGFPRTIKQAKRLDEMIQSMGNSLDDVLVLECPEGDIIKRITGRRTCETCGAVYHVVFNPSESADQCDFDGGKLKQRDDDTEETALKRLRVYEERTAPLIEFYEDKKLVKAIDAARDIEAVRDAVLQLVG